MAVTIDASPTRVWPWLVQMGYDRPGWHSWDHLDNLGQPSAERIHPEWQDIQQGDYAATRHSWQVAAFEPERSAPTRLRTTRTLPETSTPGVAAQNRCWSSRLATVGLPGDRIGGRPDRSDLRFLRSAIATPLP